MCKSPDNISIDVKQSARHIYRNDPKFSVRYAWANSVDPDQTAPLGEEQSDQGLHCLPFRLHRLDLLLYGEPHNSNFTLSTKNFWVSEYLGNLRQMKSKGK